MIRMEEDADGTRLLRDYEAKAAPNTLIRLVKGHRANVKCVDVIDDHLAVSGSRCVSLL